MSVAQAELFRNFAEVNQNGFLEDAVFQIIVRVFEESRLRNGFWQFKLYVLCLKDLTSDSYPLLVY